MEIISRSAAGLPAPSALTRRSSPWAGITWHHTGGSPTTWKAIHDWQTKGRPAGDRLVYCGYSYGIGLDGRVTELRGWDYRAAGDHENSRLQVCFMGNWFSKLPPQAALDAAREFAAWAQNKAGKPMPGVAHRDVWSGGPYDTDCPGNALYAWVRANLATAGEDDDMQLTDRINYVKGAEASYSQDSTTVGTMLGQTLYYVLATRNKVTADAAADKVRDEAILGLLKGAAGGSVDVLPVLERINAVRDEVLAKLEAEFNALQLERDELAARLAEALKPTE